MEVLDSGHGGLDRLRQVTNPSELLTAINLAARERPDLFAETLFAAIVLYRGWGASQPTEIVRLREQWHWHVHQQIQAPREGRSGRRLSQRAAARLRRRRAQLPASAPAYTCHARALFATRLRIR